MIVYVGNKPKFTGSSLAWTVYSQPLLRRRMEQTFQRLATEVEMQQDPPVGPPVPHNMREGVLKKWWDAIQTVQLLPKR